MIEKIICGGFETNTYVISNEGKCVIVDPGLDFLEYSKEIKSKYEVEAILITHGHIDHIDGIKYFPNTPIYIHELDEEFLYDSRLSLYNFMGLKTPFTKNTLKINKVKENDTLNLIGFEFKVMHTPGHTKGSCCYLYKNKLLSGDTLFKNSCGRTDFPTGSPRDIKKSLKRIISECLDTVDVYPGHDSKTKIKDEKKNNPYIL